MISIRVLSGSIIAALIAFGCSSSSGTDVSCGADSSVTTCQTGSTGYSCSGGAVPDTSLNCSDPVSDPNGNTDYCCDTGGGSCGADSSITTCESGSAGYSCSGGAVPDTSLNCSDPVADANGNTDYCCATSTADCTTDSSVDCSASGATGYSCPTGVTPDSSAGTCSDPTATANGDTYCCTTSTGDSCTADSSVTCMANASGYSCTGTATPDSTLDCSDPTAVSGGNEYCCFTFSSSTCMADDSVSGCTGDSYGFSCTGSDSPDSSDSTLTCSDGVASGSDTIYCCIDNTDTSCTQDSSLSCPTPGSFGFSCTSSDSPMTSDPTLTCSDGVADGANTDFCCTN